MDNTQNPDPFEEYYEMMANQKGTKPPLSKENKKDKDLSFLNDMELSDYAIDHEAVGRMIDGLYHDLGDRIAQAFEAEKRRGVVAYDVAAASMVSCVAYAAAEAYRAMVKELGAKMSREEYEVAFMKMLQAALNNIAKGRGG